MAKVTGAPVHFKEAIDFFNQKVRIPTKTWADLLHGEHARGFMIAGAERDDMLCDFQAALVKSQSGATLEEFRKDFDAIVAKYGWQYKGGRNWRTKVIYQTNLRTAYHAGRYAQMTDPDVVAYRPFWRYHHSDLSKVPREDHLSWDGLVLAWDDPWWKTHYPPNGWGCNCWVEALSHRDLERLGKTGPDQAPPENAQPVTLQTGGGPVTVMVPEGVDPGWGYNVGEAAWGQPLADTAMAAWKAKGGEAWQRLTEGDWKSEDRPEMLPAVPATSSVGPRLATPADAEAALNRLLGGPEKVFQMPDGSPLLINAAALAAHLPADRTPFLPLLPDLIERPAEMWQTFEQHKGTGQVVLRRRLIQVLKLAADRVLVLVAQTRRGLFEAWSVIPTSKANYVQSQRQGNLLWARDGDGPRQAGPSPGDG